MDKDVLNTNAGAFGNINIEDIEAGLGLLLPGSGEPAKDADDAKEVKKPTGGIDLTKMIEVPDTAEDFAALGADDGVEKKKTEKVKETETSGVSQTGADDEGESSGEEDAIITEDSPLYLHAATLHEEGILPTLNLDDLKGKKYSEAVDLYLAAQKAYIEEGRNEFKNSLSERQKNFLELIEKGVPEEHAEHQFTVEDSYGSITDEVLADAEDLQEQIIVQNLKLKGLSDKKVQVFVKAAKDDERLFEEAKEARDDINVYIVNQRKELIKRQEDAEREAERKEKELQKEIQSTINSIEEILPGIKVSATEKTKLYDLMTKPIEVRTINGQKVPINLINKVRSEDRVSFDLRLNYFIEQGMFKKDFDLSKLNKKLTSSAAQRLASKLKEEAGGPSGKGLTIEKKKPTGEKPTNIVFPDIRLT